MQYCMLKPVIKTNHKKCYKVFCVRLLIVHLLTCLIACLFSPAETVSALDKGSANGCMYQVLRSAPFAS